MRDKLITIFLEQNQKLNLSAIRDREGVKIKHLQDSLKLLETGLFTPGKFVIDVGTGGGFPLMPLAMSCPEMRFLGIDSVRKKTLAVQAMLDALGVQNAELLRTRIEDYQGEKADLLTARAVAYSDKLLQWSVPLVKKGGALVLMKQVIPEEKMLLQGLCPCFQLKIEQELKYQLFEGDIERVIYVLRKK